MRGRVVAVCAAVAGLVGVAAGQARGQDTRPGIAVFPFVDSGSVGIGRGAGRGRGENSGGGGLLKKKKKNLLVGRACLTLFDVAVGTRVWGGVEIDACLGCAAVTMTCGFMVECAGAAPAPSLLWCG